MYQVGTYLFLIYAKTCRDKQIKKKSIAYSIIVL